MGQMLMQKYEKIRNVTFYPWSEIDFNNELKGAELVCAAAILTILLSHTCGGSDCTLNSYGLPSYQLQYNCSSFYKTNINKSKISAKKKNR